jgi:hypothetical protein
MWRACGPGMTGLRQHVGISYLSNRTGAARKRRRATAAAVPQFGADETRPPAGNNHSMCRAGGSFPLPLRWRNCSTILRGRSRHQLICPTGCLLIWLSSPFCKKILLHLRPKSLLQLPPSCPIEGRWPSSRTWGRDAVDAAASGVKRDAGRASACERSNGAPTNDAEAYGKVVWS